jgi:hypothetical protein
MTTVSRPVLEHDDGSSQDQTADRRKSYEWVRVWWSLPAAVLIFGVCIAIPCISSVRMNNGRRICALDDAYIHMAMAKHLAQDYIIGITKHEFAGV